MRGPGVLLDMTLYLCFVDVAKGLGIKKGLSNLAKINHLTGLITEIVNSSGWGP